MKKSFFIYEVANWPDGPLVLQAPVIPDKPNNYYFNRFEGYETVEDAEKHLADREDEEGLQGEFVILPVYHLEMD